MADMQKINPETAAHNIAKIFSKCYIETLKNPLILSVDFNDISAATKKAAELYAIAYDEAYEYFLKQNELD